MFQWRRRKQRRKDMKEAARTPKEVRSIMEGAGSSAGSAKATTGTATSSSTDAARKAFPDTKAVTDGRPRE